MARLAESEASAPQPQCTVRDGDVLDQYQFSMRSRQADDKRGNSERPQKVVNSFLSSVTSIAISSSGPSRANASAASSERLSASAKSRKLANLDVRCDGDVSSGTLVAPAGCTTAGVTIGGGGWTARRVGLPVPSPAERDDVLTSAAGRSSIRHSI